MQRVHIIRESLFCCISGICIHFTFSKTRLHKPKMYILGKFMSVLYICNSIYPVTKIPKYCSEVCRNVMHVSYYITTRILSDIEK